MKTNKLTQQQRAAINSVEAALVALMHRRTVATKRAAKKLIEQCSWDTQNVLAAIRASRADPSFCVYARCEDTAPYMIVPKIQAIWSHTHGPQPPAEYCGAKETEHTPIHK